MQTPEDMKRRLPSPLTDKEEADIRAGIAADPDNPELTEEQFARMRPAEEVLPPALYAALTRSKNDPAALEKPTIPIQLNVDADAVGAFRATGAGWQARMSDAVVEAARQLKR